MGKRLMRTAPITPTLAAMLLMGAVLPVQADGEMLPAEALDWQPWDDEQAAGHVCGGRYVMPDYRLPANRDPRELTAATRESNYSTDGEALLRGDVVLRRGDTQLEAERIFVPANRERVEARGDLALRDGRALVRGSEATLSLNSDRGEVENSHYVLYDESLRGQADRLEQTGEQQYRLHDASFTTCAPGANTWQLVSSDIRLDQASGFGTARNARLEVKDVPVFYSPWLRFPIDDRRHTGLLTPTIGFSSDQLDYAQPFYWNIAPDRDATITPRWVSDRGLLLGGEYRYLMDNGKGSVEGAWLGNDRGGSGGDANRYEGDDRWYIDARHTGRVSSRSDYRLRYGAASDGRYFNDFSGNFGESERNRMERLAQIDYRGETWQLDARAQGYQRLDDPLSDQDKPFYRLPAFTADARWQLGHGFYGEWHSSAAYFWRDVDETQVPRREAATGGRLHLAPTLGARFERPWGYIEPKTELWNTAYSLDYGRLDTSRDTEPTRSVAVTSVDAGLTFERELSLGDDAYRQTLEPRLNYAFVPRTDQRDLPEFDSRERPFSWSQLWSPHRFSGEDRVGDLNRLSYGVQTRLLEDESGREKVSAGIGQSLYFEDRRVGLDGRDDAPMPEDSAYASPESYYQVTRDRSPVVTQLDWQINSRWSTGAQWLYDDERNVSERSSVDLRYRHPDGHVMNLGYRWEIEGFDPGLEPGDDAYHDYDREEWDLSFAWNASPAIDLIGRYLHDQTNHRPLEQLAGVQWNSCCYGIQAVWRRWVDDNDTARVGDDFNDRGLFLRFVLHGLGGAGQDADSYFERTIPGYRPPAL
ncbi:LPS-assembly protein LptD [Vreelandella jeotgali]|uniref:LPS-assembly protein LptD n=1 Tax=Vreelandella jeotgali TaxID=553386 RepID=UPI00034B3C86|nr:LPS assembly protein LptD [Halomonas jeotgali]